MTLAELIAYTNSQLGLVWPRMNLRDKKEYSLTGLLRAMLDRGPGGISGIEKEFHEEALAARSYVAKPDGCFVPLDLFGSRRRDLTVGAFNSGGGFVQTDVQSEPIPLLRNSSVVQRMGAQVLTGLVGNIAIPRQTGAATAQNLGEQNQVQSSTPSIDQLVLAPHRISASVVYSKQLLLQSSVNVENFLRDDLAAQIGLAVDSAALQGQGGGQPLGILNTAGIGSIIFGGTASWSEVVAFENSLASGNALAVPNARVGWASTPSVRTRWKEIAKTGVGVSTTVPIFLMDDFVFGDGSNDGRSNGYRFASSNQILNNLVFFGNWHDVILGFWGNDLDVVVDPYSLAKQASVIVTCNIWFDSVLRHPQSFCVSADAGNQ